MVRKSESEKEMEKLETQLENFENQCKEMTLDRMNAAPKEETEGPKLSQAEIRNSKDVYLKPVRSISGREKFNEKFRESYNFAKEYVNFIAENKEIIGETIDMWTKPFAGMPAEEWLVPTNKPVWAPRYVAEQISRKRYHRLIMEDKATNSEGGMQYYGQMAVDKTVNRLDAYPVQQRQSVFMGGKSF